MVQPMWNEKFCIEGTGFESFQGGYLRYVCKFLKHTYRVIENCIDLVRVTEQALCINIYTAWKDQSAVKFHRV